MSSCTRGLRVCLFVCLSACLPACLPVCLSVCLFYWDYQYCWICSLKLVDVETALTTWSSGQLVKWSSQWLTVMLYRSVPVVMSVVVFVGLGDTICHKRLSRGKFKQYVYTRRIPPAIASHSAGPSQSRASLSTARRLWSVILSSAYCLYRCWLQTVLLKCDAISYC